MSQALLSGRAVSSRPASNASSLGLGLPSQALRGGLGSPTGVGGSASGNGGSFSTARGSPGAFAAATVAAAATELEFFFDRLYGTNEMKLKADVASEPGPSTAGTGGMTGGLEEKSSAGLSARAKAEATLQASEVFQGIQSTLDSAQSNLAAARIQAAEADLEVHRLRSALGVASGLEAGLGVGIEAAVEGMLDGLESAARSGSAGLSAPPPFQGTGYPSGNRTNSTASAAAEEEEEKK